MRKSKLSKHKQSKLLEHFVAGTTARCSASLIGINKSTGAYYFHRLREIIAYKLEQESHEVFDGEIEVDESYLRLREDKLWWAKKIISCSFAIHSNDFSYASGGCARDKMLNQTLLLKPT